MSELGTLLKKLRGKESLRDVAKRSGVSHTYLSILERGYDLRSKKPVKPTSDTLRLLAKAYHYPYDELLKIAGITDEPDGQTKSDNELIMAEILRRHPELDLTNDSDRLLFEKIISLVLADHSRKQ